MPLGVIAILVLRIVLYLLFGKVVSLARGLLVAAEFVSNVVLELFRKLKGGGCGGRRHIHRQLNVQRELKLFVKVRSIRFEGYVLVV